MSLATTSASIDEDLIFYVHEKSDSDEFTFYIDQHQDDTVVQALRQKLPKSQRAALANGGGNEVFSFAERVFVKNLHFTKDSLKWSEDFWANLTSKAPAYKYLAARIKSTGRPAASLKEKPANPKAFLKSLAQILNEIVAKEDLEQQSWAEKDLGDDTKFIEKLPAKGGTKQQWRNRLILERAFPDLIRKALPGRGLICFSYVGRYLSVTFRKMSDAQGYAAGDFSDANERKENLFSLSEYCELLYTEIFRKTGSAEHAHGLVVITGATKSAKSEIARGLIELYLQGIEKSKRRHHLVTFEDPVERFYVYQQVNGCSPWAAVQLPTDPKTNSDYTPRQKEKDAHQLQEALNDALRQTPALFFVGETRDREEWKVLLDFAATGHLILTTAHAGSLVEAMHKIFEALKVETAADRSEIANKLLGVVHLRRHELEFLEGTEKKRPNTLFPAVWRRTPRGIAALTCDGLASLVPYRATKARNGASSENGNGSLTAPQPVEPKKNANQPAVKEDGNSDAASCLGRRWIVEELITPEETTEQMQSVFGADLAERLKKQAYEKATEWDLQGV
jgi:hypothetical protein